MQIRIFQTIVLAAIVFTFICAEPFAQQGFTRPLKQNQLYLELGGNGFIYSVNYERLLSKSFSIRGGIGYTPTLIVADGDYFFIPVTGSLLAGSETSKLELGLGVTYFSGKVKKIFIYEVDSETESRLVFNGILGYRYVSSGGFIFRVAFTPFYNPDNENSNFLPWGALSFGYAF